MPAGLTPSRAQDPGEGTSETAVAHRVQEGVDGRVDPQEPEGGLVPVVLHAVAPAGRADDHQQRVGGPAHGEHAHDHRQRLGHLLVSG